MVQIMRAEKWQTVEISGQAQVSYGRRTPVSVDKRYTQRTFNELGAMDAGRHSAPVLWRPPDSVPR